VEKLDAGGRIEIEAGPENGELVLRVRDNGPGPASNPLEAGQSREEAGGVGLRNTVARLEQLYGSGQRFTLLPSSSAEGTTAEVRIPLRRSRGD
jgi:sensor histidine kinase YesM